MFVRQAECDDVQRRLPIQVRAQAGHQNSSQLSPPLFAKILRIVRKWCGNPTSAEVFPQIFDDAVYAWNTGQFEGQGVFQAADPGGSVPEKDDKAGWWRRSRLMPRRLKPRLKPRTQTMSEERASGSTCRGSAARNSSPPITGSRSQYLDHQVQLLGQVPLSVSWHRWPLACRWIGRKPQRSCARSVATDK